MIKDKHKVYIVAPILFIVLVLQIPAHLLFKHGDMRDVFVFLMQIGFVLSLAAFVGVEANVWWGLFLASALIASFYPNYSDYSLKTLYMITMGCFWYVFIVKWVKIKYVEWIYILLRLAILVHVFFIILQYFGIDPLHGPSKYAGTSYGVDVPTGILCNLNLASAFLAFGFVLFFKRWWKLCILLILPCFVATITAGGVISLCAGLIFYAWFKGHKVWPIITAAISVALFIKFVDAPIIRERWIAWNDALTIYWQCPWMGMGLGHFKVVYPGLTKHLMEQAHNDCWQAWLEMGMAFPIIFAGYLITTWERFKPVAQQALIPMSMLVIFIANSLVNFPWHVGRTAFYMVTIMAILEIILRSNTKLKIKHKHWWLRRYFDSRPL